MKTLFQKNIICGRIALLAVLFLGIRPSMLAEPTRRALLPPPERTAPIFTTVTGQLDVSASTDAIRATGFDDRAVLATEIEQRVGSSFSTLNGFTTKSSNLTEQGQKEFNEALQDAQRRKADLERSISSARRISSANEWELARDELAANYALYVAAVARCEIGLMKTLPSAGDSGKPHSNPKAETSGIGKIVWPVASLLPCYVDVFGTASGRRFTPEF